MKNYIYLHQFHNFVKVFVHRTPLLPLNRDKLFVLITGSHTFTIDHTWLKV